MPLGPISEHDARAWEDQRARVADRIGPRSCMEDPCPETIFPVPLLDAEPAPVNSLVEYVSGWVVGARWTIEPTEIGAL